jgi:hypothetical protein
MRSRRMSLLPRTTLHSDSEQKLYLPTFMYATVLNKLPLFFQHHSFLILVHHMVPTVCWSQEMFPNFSQVFLFRNFVNNLVHHDQADSYAKEVSLIFYSFTICCCTDWHQFEIG